MIMKLARTMIIKSVSGVLCGAIGAFAFQLFQKRGQWGKKLGMTFLGAGAISNTFDRLVRGYVIDYYGFEFKNSKLSKITANLADLYVVIGSAIILAVKAGFYLSGNSKGIPDK